MFDLGYDSTSHVGTDLVCRGDVPWLNQRNPVLNKRFLSISQNETYFFPLMFTAGGSYNPPFAKAHFVAFGSRLCLHQKSPKIVAGPASQFIRLSVFSALLSLL